MAIILVSNPVTEDPGRPRVRCGWLEKQKVTNQWLVIAFKSRFQIPSHPQYSFTPLTRWDVQTIVEAHFRINPLQSNFVFVEL